MPHSMNNTCPAAKPLTSSMSIADLASNSSCMDALAILWAIRVPDFTLDGFSSLRALSEAWTGGCHLLLPPELNEDEDDHGAGLPISWDMF